MVTKRTVLAMVFILLAALMGGCAENAPSTQEPSNKQIPNQQQQATVPDSQKALGQGEMVITVYNATKDAMYVVGEKNVVPKNDHPAQTAMELLVAGAKNSELVSVMPKGTKLRNISIKDNIAYVDFNDNLVKNNRGGSASERLLVASIVNTLTEFEDIQQVQIMVEGKKIDTISGHMDTGEPLSRSEKIIKR